jgi:hypothetical protein
MAKFIILIIGLVIIIFVYYIIGWFILNQQNAFLWPWYVKILYIFLVLASWGNYTESIKDE